ncbi:MAG: universal stress protein [Kofleriaceae bacterium]|nr:universal stress protein [Kofleriaceae bacterium]
MREKTEQLMRGEPFTYEWVFVEMLNFAALSEGVAVKARAADLVIASQGPVEADWLSLDEVPEVVALKSGRPVLVIPRTGTFDSFGDAITVAWDGRREAARAVFDALPLLQKAKRVRVVTVTERNGKRGSNEVPGADIAVALDRQGVRVETATCADGSTGAGGALLADAAGSGCDMLVMGAYGHSRLREFVLGGATRHVLQKATVPVLMSH